MGSLFDELVGNNMSGMTVDYSAGLNERDYDFQHASFWVEESAFAFMIAVM